MKIVIFNDLLPKNKSNVFALRLQPHEFSHHTLMDEFAIFAFVATDLKSREAAKLQFDGSCSLVTQYSAEALEEHVWQNCLEEKIEIEFCGGKIVRELQNANDQWQFRLQARIKTLMISGNKVKRTPWVGDVVWCFCIHCWSAL